MNCAIAIDIFYTIKDCIPLIASFINDRGTFRSFCLTCKQFNKVASAQRYRFYNDLILLLQNYPGECYDWNKLSANPCIPFSFIVEHPYYPWTRFVSANINVRIEDIIKYPTLILIQLKYIRTVMSIGEIEPIDDIYEHEWDFDMLSLNPNMSPRVYARYPHMPWNRRALNANQSWRIYDLIAAGIFSHRDYSHNPNLRVTDLLANPGADWDWIAASQNPGIPASALFATLGQLPFALSFICKNPAVSLDDVIGHLCAQLGHAMGRFPTNEEKRRTALGYGFLDGKFVFGFCLQQFIDNPSTDLAIIRKYDYLRWKTADLCRIAPYSYVKEYISDINYRIASENPTIRFEDIIEIADWDFIALSGNTFGRVEISRELIYNYTL